MDPDREPDMFTDDRTEMDIEKEEEEEPVVQLVHKSGEKGFPLGYQGKTFFVKEGKCQRIKLHIAGQCAYTYEWENSHLKTSRPTAYLVIHLKDKKLAQS